jgi:hypothetical protein
MQRITIMLQSWLWLTVLELDLQQTELLQSTNARSYSVQFAWNILAAYLTLKGILIQVLLSSRDKAIASLDQHGSKRLIF